MNRLWGKEASFLDLQRILAELIAEREKLDNVICVLSKLRQPKPDGTVVSDKPRRGRPLGSRNKPKLIGTDVSLAQVANLM